MPWRRRMTGKCFFDRTDDCAALNDRECDECTFCKTQEQVYLERQQTIWRLEELGRQDLIEKYRLRSIK